MVPWGTGDPISPGYLNTQVFLTGKPPPLSVSVGGGSMSPALHIVTQTFHNREVFSFFSKYAFELTISSSMKGKCLRTLIAIKRLKGKEK